MSGTRRGSILGLLVFALVVAAGPSAFAQSRDRFSPSTAGVRFTQPAAQTHDWKPQLDLSTVSGTLAAPRQSTQNRAHGIGFGVEAGFQHSIVDEQDIDETTSGNGVMLGAWVGGNKGGRVGFTGEFLYIMRNFDLEEDVDGDGTNDKFKTRSFEIPAVFHVNFGRGGPEDPMGYALVGPVFTFLLSQKLNDVKLDEDKPFKGADVGVMFGGGVEIFRFAVEVRYNMGLRNISSEGDTGKIKTRQLEVVVKFRLSGA